MMTPGRNQPSPGAVAKAQALQAAVQHHQNGQLALAQALYRQVLQADPNQPDALQLLGLIEHQQGHSAVAVELIGRAIQARPHAAMYHFNLGNTLHDMGQLDQAVNSFRQAIALQPNFPEASYNLGNALKTMGRLDEAIASYRQALSFNPGWADAHLKIGNAQLALGRTDEALASVHQALLLKPDDVSINLDYAKMLVERGRLDEGVAVYRHVLALQPGCAGAHTDLLLTLQYMSSCSAEALFQEHVRFAEMIEAPLKPLWRPHVNSRESERRLKVGYVSADFCAHVVAFFIEPILAHHDKSRFEVYGYYNNTRNDDHTAKIMGYLDHFQVCWGLGDEQLAQRIRQDGIDILVDLSGHTALNRLPAFARRPAPVQCTYIGYPGSTGLSAIDYRISDPWQDPPDLTERYHSETVVRIPGGMAFDPGPDTPEVNALPALTSGDLVLACLNNLSKVGPEVIHLWSRILLALPQARLLIGNLTSLENQARLLRMFEQAGVPAQRLRLQPRVSMAEYLALHHQIDIALDPFPYNGGTTTMFSLWMGVPVITLAGDHAVSRLSTAHLSRVGLDEFITHSEEEYLQCAVNFANNLPKLNEVRQSLRQRMTAPSCDPAKIARQLESAYRDMWRTWCRS